MKLNQYEQIIVHFWDIQKVSKLIMDKVPFEHLIFDKTDVLLETILRSEFILSKRILERGFPVNHNKFNYLIPILDSYTEENRKYLDLLFEYVDPKSYINRKSFVTQENGLSIVCKQANQDIIVELSKLGGDWNSTNNLNQTPLYYILRNHTVFSSDLIKEIEKTNIDIDKKDNFGINIKDILDNFLLIPGWLNDNNMQLIKAIKYENRK